MTDQGFPQERPNYGAQGQGETNIGPVPGYSGQGAGYPGQAAGYPGQGAAYPGNGGTGWGPQQGIGDAKGFVASLFDFGFSSFVTPKIIKVVYILVMIGLALGSLGVIAEGFLIGPLYGIIFLIIVAPLYFFVGLALWRIFLEVFMVIFRAADDLRAIRNRGN